MLLALLALFTASSTSEYVDLGSGLGCNTSAEVALASTRLYLYTQLPELAGRLEPCRQSLDTSDTALPCVTVSRL